MKQKRKTSNCQRTNRKQLPLNFQHVTAQLLSIRKQIAQRSSDEFLYLSQLSLQIDFSGYKGSNLYAECIRFFVQKLLHSDTCRSQSPTKNRLNVVKPTETPNSFSSFPMDYDLNYGTTAKHYLCTGLGDFIGNTVSWHVCDQIRSDPFGSGRRGRCVVGSSYLLHLSLNFGFCFMK